MILETVTNLQNQGHKCIHKVNLNAKDDFFTIGRGKDSDIRISDISVSRLHAQIEKQENGDLVLYDNNSKFGTLILITKPIMLPAYIISQI